MSGEERASMGSFWDPDPDTRLDNWHTIARQHISADMCLRLAQLGMPALARELMRQRGDIP
jgi:hypothetical protein